MSVDTRDKRFSMVGITSPTLRMFQDPVATIGAIGRAMLLFLYSGLTIAPPPVIGTPPRQRILYIGARNNGLIIPRRNNILYVPARQKLIHDF
jgi:hypothetical protein